MNISPLIARPGPAAERYDTHLPNAWVRENRFLSIPPLSAELPSFAKTREQLPEPFWAGHTAVIDCYWRAWELAFGNLKRPTLENGFSANYCDTAFNGNLFMWDSSFVTCFGIYARRVFNFQTTLDNFYRKQHADGFICREISEADGGDCFPRFDPSSTGPNVLGWAEANYFKHTADRGRLEMVFPALVAYHQWLRTNRTWPDGSYWSTGWGTGMDNLPRVPGSADQLNWAHAHMSWVDATLQAVLSARVLLQMADQLGRSAQVQDLRDEAERLSDYCNQKLWNEGINFYCDRLASGELSPVKQIGAYWALLAGCTPGRLIPGLVAHLENPAEFKRLHRIPALSADDPAYSPTGGYWCGGVWAPTNFMVLKGLGETGYQELAHQIAKNHLECVVQVFESDDARWTGAEQFRQYFHLPDLQVDEKHTLWENYAPDVIEPGSQSKPGYVGWTGLPPIAVLLEDVFGLSADAPAQRLSWRVHLLEQHGVRRYPFGRDGLLDISCLPRRSALDRPSIEVHSNVPLTLNVIWEGGTETVSVQKES